MFNFDADRFLKIQTGEVALTAEIDAAAKRYVAEGIDRIGSLAVSITASNKSNTATVIPSKYNPVFINTISEKVSSMINGICIVSLYSTNQLNLEDMKAIMGEIMNIVGGKHIGDDRKTEIERRRW